MKRLLGLGDDDFGVFVQYQDDKKEMLVIRRDGREMEVSLDIVKSVIEMQSSFTFERR